MKYYNIALLSFVSIFIAACVSTPKLSDTHKPIAAVDLASILPQVETIYTHVTSANKCAGVYRYEGILFTVVGHPHQMMHLYIYSPTYGVRGAEQLPSDTDCTKKSLFSARYYSDTHERQTVSPDSGVALGLLIASTRYMQMLNSSIGNWPKFIDNVVNSYDIARTEDESGSSRNPPYYCCHGGFAIISNSDNWVARIPGDYFSEVHARADIIHANGQLTFGPESSYVPAWRVSTDKAYEDMAKADARFKAQEKAYQEQAENARRAWVDAKNSRKRLGDKVCTWSNRFGYVERISQSKIKIHQLGKVLSSHSPGFFFKSQNAARRFSFTPATTRDVWSESDQWGLCDFKNPD